MMCDALLRPVVLTTLLSLVVACAGAETERSSELCLIEMTRVDGGGTIYVDAADVISVETHDGFTRVSYDTAAGATSIDVEESANEIADAECL